MSQPFTENRHERIPGKSYSNICSGQPEVPDDFAGSLRCTVEPLINACKEIGLMLFGGG
jgi:hypothetical protein